MVKFIHDLRFSCALDDLLKTKEKQAFRLKKRALEDYVISSGSVMTAFNLAYQLDGIGVRSSRMETFIAENDSGKYILRLASQVRNSNIKKLQSAILKNGNAVDIAKFACFVVGANEKMLEDAVINSAKAAYIYLRFAKHCNVQKMKSAIMSSMRPRYLYMLATKLKNNQELKRLQDMIINSGSCMYMRLFASNIKNADIELLEDHVIRSKNMIEMKRFAKTVKSPRIEKLMVLF